MNETLAIQCLRRLCRDPLEPRPTRLSPRLRPACEVRAVLFDVYGTLLVSGSGDIGTASAAASSQALRGALDAAGLAGSLDDAARSGAQRLEDAIRARHADLKGRGVEHPEVEIREVWRDVLDFLAARGLLDRADDPSLERVAIEHECRVNPVWPMPGLLETLQALRARGVALGIVSNAQFYTPLLFPALVGRDLASLGFDPDLCAWSFRAREAKPSQRLFREALDGLAGRGAAPEATLFVGNDLLNDIWPATRARCRTALFAGDARSLRLREGDERCRGLQPDWIVTDLRQIPECFA